jgi:hypothetical protein
MSTGLGPKLSLSFPTSGDIMSSTSADAPMAREMSAVSSAMLPCVSCNPSVVCAVTVSVY